MHLGQELTQTFGLRSLEDIAGRALFNDQAASKGCTR
jgi:hypothetical protein